MGIVLGKIMVKKIYSISTYELYKLGDKTFLVAITILKKTCECQDYRKYGVLHGQKMRPSSTWGIKVALSSGNIM